MAFSLFKPICAAIVVTTLSVPTTSQEPDRKKAIQNVRPAAAATKNQERALAVIDLILGASRKFSDDWLRLKTQTQIADILWDYKQLQARRLFEDTFRATDSLTLKVGQGGYVTTAPPSVDSQKFEMRKEILKAVSMHNSELAEKLATSIPLVKYPNSQIGQMAFDWEIVEHELNVAKDVVGTDPQRAARLARDTINRRISHSFTEVILSMRTGNPELADRLFLDALAAVQLNPTYISNKIGTLAPYVFPKLKEEPDDYSNVQTNPELVSRFLDFVYDVLTRVSSESQVNENSPFGTASFDYETLRAILPHFEKQSPARAAVARSLIDDIVKKINQAGRRDMWDGEDAWWAELFKSSVAELISKAEGAKSKEEADDLYSDAAIVLTDRDNQFDKALVLIEKITDQKKRAQILSMLRPGAIHQAIEGGDTERAYKYTSGVTDLSQHIRILQEIARKMVDKKEDDRAVEVVNESIRLIQNLSDKSGRAEALLALAGTAARLSPGKGFDVMQSAVDAINRAEFGPHWTGQTTYKKTKLDEPPQTIREVNGLEDLEFSASFPILARADFSKALALAQAIRMNEASLLAQLAVCRGALSSSDTHR